MTGICAYLITRARPIELPVPEVYLLTHGEIALVVAEADPAGFTVDEQELTADSPVVGSIRRHDAVVRAVFAGQPVLPLRFGTVFTDETAALGLLADHHDELRDRLDELADHREWGARVHPPDASGPDELDTGGLSGTEYLLMRQRQLSAADVAKRRRDIAAATMHLALAGHATDSTRRERTGVLLDGVYLIPNDRESDFRAEFDRLAGDLDAQGISAELTGPWPPYSFTHLELAAAHA